MTTEPTYRCSECGRAVAVVNGETIRVCQCDAPAIGQMSATARGVGGLKG
jgi:hypothetical protein